MSNPKTSKAWPPSRGRPDLLDTIRALRLGVGDALNDDEVTRLLCKTVLPTEAGFTFLSYSERYVVLTVPQQDSAKWHPRQGWIVAEKEAIARAIAKTYGLKLSEPPDVTPRHRSRTADLPGEHHHLEFSNRRETVVVAHPGYLKVRIFDGDLSRRYEARGHGPPLFGPNLLQDLSALYQS